MRDIDTDPRPSINSSPSAMRMSGQNLIMAVRTLQFIKPRLLRRSKTPRSIKTAGSTTLLLGFLFSPLRLRLAMVYSPLLLVRCPLSNSTPTMMRIIGISVPALSQRSQEILRVRDRKTTPSPIRKIPKTTLAVGP